ncbi:MAG TPA: hypothetical protein VJR03_02825 [Nitrospira sp.]|nr:hypothetical protein [Nitrospira sp.]
MRSRRFDPIDIAVVSGALLTVFGAMLLWVSTQGTFQMNTQVPATTHIDKQTIEEALGKAVVTATLIEQKHTKEISRAARKLNAETITAENLEDSGNDRVQQVVDERNEQERSKAARQEFVKGQEIVKGTLRSKGPQPLPEAQWSAFNGHVITAAAKEADRIDRVFRTNAPAALNTALQNETQVHAVAQQKSQEQAGDAIVEASVTEEEYAAASGSIQEQLGSLVSRAAAAHML